MKLPSWQVQDFSGGMVDVVEANLIPDNACVDVQNCTINQLGLLEKRNGQVVLSGDSLGGAIQGLHSFYYGDNLEYRKFIAVANGVVYKRDGAGWTSIKTGLNTSAPVMMATLVNYMVGFNGIDAPWKYDGTTVSALANAPVTGKCPVLHKEKLFVITDVDTVKWSDSFAPETWPAVNFWDFDKGDGDELTLLCPYARDLLVKKKHSINTLSGSSLDDFRVDKVEANYGAVGIRAAVEVNPYLYYINEDGVIKWNGITANNLIDNKIPLFWKNQINPTPSVLAKACIWYWDYKLWVALPGTGSSYNNVVLIYDLKTKSWWKYSGINAACFATYNDGTSVLPYIGSANDGYIIKIDDGYLDRTATISSYLISKEFDAKSGDLIKKVKKLFVTDVPVNILTTNQYSVETDTTGFTVYNGTTLTKDGTKYVYGSYSLKCACPGTNAACEGFYVNEPSFTGSASIIKGTVWLCGTADKVVNVRLWNQTAGTYSDDKFVTLKASEWTLVEVYLSTVTGAANIRLLVHGKDVGTTQEAFNIYGDGFILCVLPKVEYRIDGGPWVTPDEKKDWKNERRFKASEKFRKIQVRLTDNEISTRSAVSGFSIYYKPKRVK
jgi:hypothetical protein